MGSPRQVPVPKYCLPPQGWASGYQPPCHSPASLTGLWPGIQGPIQAPTSHRLHRSGPLCKLYSHPVHTHAHIPIHAYASTHTYIHTYTQMDSHQVCPLKVPLHVLTPSTTQRVWFLPHQHPQYSQQGPKAPCLPVPVLHPSLPGHQTPPSLLLHMVTSCCFLSPPPLFSLGHLTYLRVSCYACPQRCPQCPEESARVEAADLSPTLSSSFTQLQPHGPSCCSLPGIPAPHRPGFSIRAQLKPPPQKAFPDLLCHTP